MNPQNSTENNPGNNPGNDDQDLRALLHETADQITPYGNLDDIRERTPRASKRRWILPSVAAAAAMLLVVGGVGWLVRSNVTNTHAAGSPATDPVPEFTWHQPIYFVGQAADGYRLFPDTVMLRACADCLLTASVDAALQGRTNDVDYTSPWELDPTTTVAVSTSPANAIPDSLVIDLGQADLAGRPAGMGAKLAGLAVQQLVYTAQAAYSAQHDGATLPVQFQLNHQNTDTLLGVPTAGPVEVGNADELVAPVQIASPTSGAKVPAGKVTVTGVASTFEANVVWEVLNSSDAVVKSGFTTAAECCTLSPYSFTVDLQPGTYTVVAHDTDESGAGRPVNQDTKEIVVE